MDERDLVRIKQLALLANLSTGVLHTLNNILQAISGYSQLAMHRHPDDPSAETLARVVNWAQEAGRQSRAVLALGRRDETATRGEVETAVKRTAEMFATQSLENESIQVSWRDLAWLPPVKVSTESLQIVLGNLVKNALEMFKGRGGTIRIDAEEGDEVVIMRVWNSGPQIPAHTLRRLFTPWMSTKPIGQGHGIGLYLSRELLRQAGGTINVRNTETSGVEFTLELPTTVDEVSESDDGQQSKAARLNGRRILLVEDDESVREVMRMVIPELTGAAIDVAESSRSAMQSLSTASYDLILLDLRLPGMSGQELFHRLAPEQRLRVVFVTGDIVSPGIEEFIHSSGRPVLLKPIDVNRLIETMQRSLQS
jgi:two-component system, cell cycle sensor histidine kinase and response regulator CckA